MVDLASFRWLRGESELSTWKVPEAQRFRQTFCSHCGSPMPVALAQFGRAVIPAGSFEDDPGVREAFHIFVDSKAPWEVIEGPLPQHAEYPPPPFPPVARAAS
jgi:hypothetical protein